MSSHKVMRSAALLTLALFTFTACGSSDQAAPTSSASAPVVSSATSSPSASAAPSATSDTGLVAQESWIKANSGAMTGSFARITNTSDKPITITGATSSVAGMVELHTTVMDSSTGTSTMKKVEGGFTIEPGATLELAPGSDHIMLMDMKCALVAGASDTITLQTSAGEYSFDAEVRDYSGAMEEYTPGGEKPGNVTMGESGDHSMHSMNTEGSENPEATLPQCA